MKILSLLITTQSRYVFRKEGRYNIIISQSINGLWFLQNNRSGDMEMSMREMLYEYLYNIPTYM